MMSLWLVAFCIISISCHLGATECFFQGDFFMYGIQHCFICRPSDSTVSEDAGIEPRTVATEALAVRRSNYSARSHPTDWGRSHPQTRLDLIHTRLDLIHRIIYVVAHVMLPILTKWWQNQRSTVIWDKLQYMVQWGQTETFIGRGLIPWEELIPCE